MPTTLQHAGTQDPNKFNIIKTQFEIYFLIPEQYNHWWSSKKEEEKMLTCLEWKISVSKWDPHSAFQWQLVMCVWEKK